MALPIKPGEDCSARRARRARGMLVASHTMPWHAKRPCPVCLPSHRIASHPTAAGGRQQSITQANLGPVDNISAPDDCCGRTCIAGQPAVGGLRTTLQPRLSDGILSSGPRHGAVAQVLQGLFFLAGPPNQGGYQSGHPGRVLWRPSRRQLCLARGVFP